MLVPVCGTVAIKDDQNKSFIREPDPPHPPMQFGPGIAEKLWKILCAAFPGDVWVIYDTDDPNDPVNIYPKAP